MFDLECYNLEILMQQLHCFDVEHHAQTEGAVKGPIHVSQDAGIANYAAYLLTMALPEARFTTSRSVCINSRTWSSSSDTLCIVS